MVESARMSRSKKHKKNAERKNGASVLRNWQAERLARDRELPIPPRGPSEVSLLAYHLPDPSAPAEGAFDALECAVRESWRQCGLLHTVLVAPSADPALEAFAAPFGPMVEVQVEPSLVPGRPETVATDLIARLPERFFTPFVLVVREDGFPLRPGLGSFLDHWDFVGAPAVRDHWWTNLRAEWTNRHRMDGGFSLRTRAFCERVAAEWASRRPGATAALRGAMSDGAFQTDTLPGRSFAVRRSARLPSAREAIRFSYAGVGSATGGVPPFGFRGAEAFRALLESGRIP